MENFSSLLTKKINVSGQDVLSPNLGISLKLRPVGGGDDITLSDPGNVAIYKGTIPTGVYKVIKDGQDLSGTYGYVAIFDGTITADMIVSGQISIERIPDLAMSKITGLSDALNTKVSRTGDTMSGPLNMQGHPITMVQIPTNTNDAASKGYVDLVAVKKMGDTMEGNLDFANVNKPTGLASPTADKDGANKKYVDDKSDECLKKENNTDQILQGTGKISILNEVKFGENYFPIPRIFGTPTDDTHIVNKNYVEKFMQNYINGQITAYQQSVRIIRILHNGVEEANRVYTTLQSGITAASANASATNQMLCVLEDDTEEGIMATDLHDYVHIAGGCETNKLIITAGDYIVGASNNDRGKIIFTNINFVPKSGAVMFRRAVFENCSFDGVFQSLIFDNCEFRGCRFKIIGSGAFTLTDCVGMPFITDIHPTGLTGNNPPYWKDNNLNNIKIKGSLLFNDDETNSLFDTYGALYLSRVDADDAGLNTLFLDTASNNLCFKDINGNFNYFNFNK